MRNKGKILFGLLSILILISGSVFAETEIEQKVKHAVPQSWFEGSKTASQLNIKEFDQSPILDEKVKSGELPAVEKRLPEDPLAIEPIDRIGDYGGTHIIFNDDLNTVGVDWMELIEVKFFRPTPLQKEVVPSLAKEWSFNKDHTVFTLKLRKDVKWSDGTPFNADDIVYWWEAEAKNEDINPISPENWNPIGWNKIEKVDKYTVKIYFNKPNPLFIKRRPRFSNLQQVLYSPAHSLKQYHPDYCKDVDQLEKLVDEEGFEEWYQLYEYVKQRGKSQTEFHMPVLDPYVVKSASSNSVLLERNPYYPFVDTEGNQLPYIDYLRVKRVVDWEVYNAKVSTGEVTFGVHRTDFQKLPLYKSKEKEENFKVTLGQRIHSSQVQFMPNLNHPDSDIKELMQNVNFRKALSYSINRDEINRTLYFDMAEPSQITVHPAHPNYKQSHQKYLEYDPKQARNILDKINVIDKNGDGFRELENGESFNLLIEVPNYRPIVSKVCELVTEYWKDIGIQVDFKLVDWGLWDTRMRNSEFDITASALDKSGPLSFPGVPNRSCAWVPTNVFPWAGAQWVEWSRWNQTGGEEGIEPPKKIKNLINWYNEAFVTTEEEKRNKLLEKILKQNSEELYHIGTVGRWKAVLIANQNLKNYPEDFTFGSYTSYHAHTLFYEGGEAK